MLVKIIFIGVVLAYASGQATLNKEYKVETYFKANWYDANIFCRDHGMRLATINSPEETQAVYTLMQQVPVNETFGMTYYNNVWISATDLAQEGRFIWFSTGQVISYSAWSYGHPFRGDQSYQFDEFGQPLPKEVYENSEDCVQIRGSSSGWENANCTDLNYFLCERV